MSTQDNIGLDYTIANKHYLLTKTELHCKDHAQPKNNFSIALNAIDPHYSYDFNYSIFGILAGVYLTFGVIVRSFQWLTGSPRFDLLANTQLIVFLGFLFLFCLRSYKSFKDEIAFNFSFLYENQTAFSIPKTRKNPEKTQAFLDAIVNKIEQATPSNQRVLYLLCHYDLLTKTEWAKLDATITSHEIDKAKQTSNILHLASRCL